MENKSELNTCSDNRKRDEFDRSWGWILYQQGLRKPVDGDSSTPSVCGGKVGLSSEAAQPPTNLDSQDLIAVQSSQRRETRQPLKGQTAEHGTSHTWRLNTGSTTHLKEEEGKEPSLTLFKLSEQKLKPYR